MKFLSALLASSFSLLLAACGGGSSAPDTTSPLVSKVSIGPLVNGQVTLTAEASDAVGVTAYCFKTESSAPAASNSCFTASASKAIADPTAKNKQYIWAKDAANNVSALFMVEGPFYTDTTAPVISAINVSAPSNGQLTLTVSANDDLRVTGYCLKTNATAPLASDACFTASASQSVATPATPTPYFAWAKDSVNNVSSAFNRVAGACSNEGVTASQTVNLPTVCISTSLGEMVVALESSKAPITSANFLKYVNDGYFSQTVFHRVISNFMIQGGGFTGVPISSANAKKGTLYDPIELETTQKTGLSNTVGTLAMARTNVLNSATHEFFINTVDNTFLNDSSGGYAVFGRVISGLNTTVENIRNVPVQNNGSAERSQPLTPPVINWAYPLK
ncbi:peptidylprolyl isomerase [Limnohabitans sp. 2KL-3]|uniref:peptidylprolyl isomerase n=1 Tax=Limnohabitans sp. 2KL-3 TaxID=1100700 RepID=UPI000B15663B|nr:peptidylprolyl isomerase [Limnohabitans sp. 2KL-3]